MPSELDEYFEYQGFRIPLRLMPATGDTAEQFHLHCEIQIDVLERLFEIRPDMSILGIGCGLARDAIPLTKILGPEGSYLGIDVQRELIDWNVANITARHPNFRFSHVDIREPWFNPNGAVILPDYKIPARDATVDLVTLFSIFTHILPNDLRFYLSEFRRVLRPTGRVYASVFLVDDEILTRQDPQSITSFHHLFDDGCYLHDPAYPTQCVGYRFEALNRLAQQSGLELAIPPLRGHWSGLALFTLPPWAESLRSPGYNRHGFGGQDSIVLRRRAGA